MICTTKGLIDYHQNKKSGTQLHRRGHQYLRKLYLSGNDCIGDGGAAALAAALKLSGEEGGVSDVPILEKVDLSSCNVGDGGAGAMAMAIECSPGCLASLDLSNNKISDRGAIALAKAMKAGKKKMMTATTTTEKGRYCIDCLDLSSNVDIGDDGTEALFDALRCGAVRRILLRSCSIKWGGAEALGVAIGKMLCDEEVRGHLSARVVEVDLSGNKLGTKKIKKKESVYSTKSVISGMNFLGNKLKTDLKDVGLSNMVSSSLESDDEAEMEDLEGGELPDLDDLPSSQCGACAMYDGLKEALSDMPAHGANDFPQLDLTLGLRMCNFDDKALDALAATCVSAAEDGKARACIDCAMNEGTPESEVQELGRGSYESPGLVERAKAHLASVQAIQEARESAEAESRLNDFFSVEEDFSGTEYDKYDNGYSSYDD